MPLLFTENETNNARLFGSANASPYVKDGINNFVVHGDAAAVNPAQQGTKVAAHYQLDVGAGETQVVAAAADDARARRSPRQPFADFDAVFAERARREADAFYASVTPPAVRDDPDRANVMRQALAGMLWTKQYYYYDLDLWLDEHGAGSAPAAARAPAGAQQRVDSHVQRRHHLDAGQVGVPVVRRLGPGVPHDSAGHGRSRLRQAAARR